LQLESGLVAFWRGGWSLDYAARRGEAQVGVLSQIFGALAGSFG
jgi:hypothetical protein